jgi:hypothetical protein
LKAEEVKRILKLQPCLTQARDMKTSNDLNCVLAAAAAAPSLDNKLEF